MATLVALVQMPTQGCGAALLNGFENLELVIVDLARMLLNELFSVGTDDIG